MAKILLAHARMDRLPVRRLVEALRAAGHVPWLLEDEMLSGESLAAALARGLRDTEVVVVCLSEAAVSSGWTAFEAGLLKEHVSERVRLLQVRFEEVRPPEEAAGLGSIALFPGEMGWRSGVTRLLGALEGGGRGEESPVPRNLPPNNLPLYRKAPFFVGRERALAWLREQLAPEGRAPSSRSVLLWGRAGQGKTALALEYAERHASLYPGGIWWGRAGTVPSLALGALAGELRKQAPPAVREVLECIPRARSGGEEARAVVRALEANPEPSLLILDDLAPTEEVLAWKEFLPAGPVSVLLTSRVSSSGLTEAAWELEPLSETEAREFLDLRAPAPRGEKDAAARERLLHVWLDGNALAVAILVVFVEGRNISWEEVEQQLVQQQVQQSAATAEASGGTRGGDVLDLCIERLSPGALPRRLLEGAAVFAPELEIPLEWLVRTGLGLEASEQSESQEVRAALQALERMGLLGLRKEGVLLSGTVRDRVSALMPVGRRELAAIRGLGCVMSWLQGVEQSGDWGDVDLCRPHIEEVLRLAEPSAHASAWVMTALILAQHLMRRGAREQAKSLLLRAARGLRRWGHANEEWSDANLRVIAGTLAMNGELATAQQLLMQAVDDEASRTPMNHPRRAELLAELANVQVSCGAWSEAVDPLDRALSIDRAELGGCHERFPERLVVRAHVASMMGDAQGALAFGEEALSAGERLLAPDDVRLAPILEEVALWMSDAERSLLLLHRALDIRAKSGGGSYWEKIRLLAELAYHYKELGDQDSSRAQVARAVSLLEAGAPSGFTPLAGLIKLAEVAEGLGDTIRAQQVVVRAVSIAEGTVAPGLLQIAPCWQLALMCRKFGRESEAERLLARVRGLAADYLPESNPLRRHLEDDSSSEGAGMASAPALHLLIPESLEGAGAEALQQGLRLFSRRDIPLETKQEALRDALAAARKSEDPANGARALYLLADLEGRQGAWERAREQAREGLQLALGAGVASLVAEGYRLLGDAALHGSYYEEARMNHEEAIRRYDALGERRRALSTRSLLVTLLLQLGRSEGLEGHLSRMRECLAEADLPEEERRNLTEVLALAERRLSPQQKGVRAPAS